MTTTHDNGHDGHAATYEVVTAAFAAAEGMTNPDRDEVARIARETAAAFTPVQRDAAAQALVARLMNEVIRSNVAAIERAATSPPPQAQPRPKQSTPAHGTNYWLNRGCDCEHCDEMRRKDAEVDRQQVQRMNEIICTYRDSLRAQWTTELLESGFALGDGTTVTWGEATVEQHRQRIALLSRNAAGNLQTAARHQAAVDEIERSGAGCLTQAKRKEAAA